jgi:hypothetical protein
VLQQQQRQEEQGYLLQQQQEQGRLQQQLQEQAELLHKLREQKQQLLQQREQEQKHLLLQLREAKQWLDQQRQQLDQGRQQQHTNVQQGQEADTPPLEMTTDAPMAVLPPFEPTCIFRDHSQMDDIDCPIMQCFKHPSCTIHDPRCCAYLNYQMLIFLAAYLESKCMHDQYFVLYGTALGAFRNHTILPHTGGPRRVGYHLQW